MNEDRETWRKHQPLINCHGMPLIKVTNDNNYKNQLTFSSLNILRVCLETNNNNE